MSSVLNRRQSSTQIMVSNNMEDEFDDDDDEEGGRRLQEIVTTDINDGDNQVVVFEGGGVVVVEEEAKQEQQESNKNNYKYYLKEIALLLCIGIILVTFAVISVYILHLQLQIGLPDEIVSFLFFMYTLINICSFFYTMNWYKYHYYDRANGSTSNIGNPVGCRVGMYVCVLVCISIAINNILSFTITMKEYLYQPKSSL